MEEDPILIPSFQVKVIAFGPFAAIPASFIDSFSPIITLVSSRFLSFAYPLVAECSLTLVEAVISSS